MDFFVVFTKFYFFQKTFLHLLLSLTLHWPGNHPSHQSDKNSQNKTSHGSSSRPPEKSFFFHRLLQGKAVFYRRLAPKAKNNFFGLVQSSPLHRCLPTAALRGEVFHCKVQLSLRTWSTLLWSTLELHTTCVLPLPSPPPTFRPPPLQTNLRRTQAWGPRIWWAKMIKMKWLIGNISLE